MGLDSFNTVAAINKGEPLELFFLGEPTGVSLIVVGSHSDKVKAFQTALTIAYARRSKMAEKKGTETELMVSYIEVDDEARLKNACVRVTGWTGMEPEFNEANLKQFLINNPQWIQEVIDFSTELGK